MEFAFNFELTDDVACQDELERNSDLNTGSRLNQAEKTSTCASFEVTTFHTQSVLSKIQRKTIKLNDRQIKIVDTNALEHLILTDFSFKDTVDKSDVLSKIISHSDLVEGVYEGGLKVWECGLDLANFISMDAETSVKIQGKTILELGCGAGVPGICCVISGAVRVDFQDYNAEVLQLLTQPNVLSNVPEETDPPIVNTECHYYAGDWSSFVELDCLRDVKYDVILTAETIYNMGNYSKLHSVFDKLLTEKGLVLIAAKSYYFGVGGSIEAFMEYVQSQKSFSIEIVYTVSKGVHRSILRLERLCEKHS